LFYGSSPSAVFPGKFAQFINLVVAGIPAFMRQLAAALSALAMAGGLAALGKLGLLLRGFVFQALGTVLGILLILIFIFLVHGLAI
jgi:hypothetical protein